MMKDPFAVLGLERRFDIEATQIEQAYFKRQASSHPDRAGDTAGLASRGEDASSINEARRVLLDDESRANALLTLLGGPEASEEKALPDGLLVEMLEVRDRLMQAKQSGDPELVHALETWADEERNAYIGRLHSLFASAEQSGDRTTLAEIRRQLNGLRYVERLIEQLDPEYDGLA